MALRVCQFVRCRLVVNTWIPACCRPASVTAWPLYTCSRRAGTVRVEAATAKASKTAASGNRSTASSRANKQSSSAAPSTSEPLAKVLAANGLGSRRACEQLIKDGCVAVNGELQTGPGHKVNTRVDKITVNSKPLRIKQAASKHYFIVNKPKGYICSTKPSSEEKGKLVYDLFDDYFKRHASRFQDGRPRLFSVGRLDVASQGMLLVTNDGDWANHVAHPSSGITKEYVVALNKAPTKAQLASMLAGIDVDGRFVKPEIVEPAAPDPASAHRVRIVVNEGRNREVRRLVAAAGLDVVTLKRVRIGGLTLPRDLAIGQCRELKPAEVKKVTDIGLQGNILLGRA